MQQSECTLCHCYFVCFYIANREVLSFYKIIELLRILVGPVWEEPPRVNSSSSPLTHFNIALTLLQTSRMQHFSFKLVICC